MILQRPADKAQLDPGTPAYFMEFQTSIPGASKNPSIAHFPTDVERTQAAPIILPGTVQRRPITTDFTLAVVDPLALDEMLKEIAGCATWTFIVKFHDMSESSPANYVAQSVSGLRHIKSLMVYDPKATWYIEAGRVTQSSFQLIKPPDIDTLIGYFQAIYGDVNTPQYYPTPESPT